MAKSPDRPSAPKQRDPAKHSKKDPARPTRAKAARPDTAPLDPALADLLNPAIGQGRAGVGSQTGVPTPNPSPQGGGKQQESGLKPPADNSFDRRADFANAHRSRAAVARGFGEAPQQGYVGKTPVPPGELDPDLARALGIDEQDKDAERDTRRGVITPDMPPARLRLARSTAGEVGTVAGLASQQSLDKLLREGRPEFRQDDGGGKIWVPHRPERPEKSEGGRP